jgi:hypothetical protein
MIYVEVNINKY